MKTCISKFIDLLAVFILCLWFSRCENVTSIFPSSGQMSSDEAKCDVLEHLISSVVKGTTGQKMEILVVMPDIMRYCVTRLPVSHYLVAIRSCSDTFLDPGSSFSHPFSSHVMYSFLACKLEDSVTVLHSAFQKLILKYLWFVFYDSQSIVDLQLLSSLALLNFRLDSFLLLVDVNDKYNTQEAFKISGNGSLVTRPTNYFGRPGESSRDLRGLPLRVTGVQNDYVEYDTKIILGPDWLPILVDSFSFQILQALQFTMNFTVQQKVTYNWGDFDAETQKWDGMVGDLVNGEADLAISSAADLPSRLPVVYFNMPTNSLKIAGFFRKPSATVSPKALLAPFKGAVWLAVLFAIISNSLVLIVFKLLLIRVTGEVKDLISQAPSDGESVEINDREQDSVGESAQKCVVRNSFHDLDPGSLWGPCDCFQWAFAVFSSQGFFNVPQYDCFRIVIGMGLLSGVVITGAYSATLFSFLSVSLDSINNVEELLASSFVMSIIGSSSSLTTRFFLNSPSPSNREVYHRRRAYPEYMSLGEAKPEILRGSLVYFGDQISGYHELKHLFSVKESCDIKDLIIPHASHKQGTMVPKDSPYKRMIDFQILRMTERGWIKQLSKRFIPSRVPCGNEATFDGIRLTSVTIAFVILAFGGLISFFLIIAEKGCRSYVSYDKQL